MNQLDRLVEQHILESESHLRHIDELMAKAREAREQQRVAPDQEHALSRLEQEHNQAARQLSSLSSNKPSPATEDTVAQSEGVKGVLQTIGLELEKTLGAVFAAKRH